MLLTLLLVLLGCVLYISNSVGWAQLFWVMASGTAGGGVMLFLDDHSGHDHWWK